MFSDLVSVDDRRPGYKLHPPGHVAWATFWGGPLGGSFVLALNYARLGRRRVAGLAIGFGLLLTGALVTAGLTLPERSPSFFLNLLCLFGMWLLAKSLQGNAFERHLDQGGQRASGWAAFGLALLATGFVLGTACVCAFAFEFIARANLGEKVVFAPHEEVYFAGGATEAEARRLGHFLEASGYFDGKGPNSVRLSKSRNGFDVDFVVQPWVSNDPKTAHSFQVFAEELASEVFPDRTVSARLCDEFFEVQKALSPVSVPAGKAWREAFDIGVQGLKQGRYAEAEQQFRVAVREAERFGPDDLRLSASLYNQALAYLNQGACTEADPLFRRALTLVELARGPGNVELARYLDGLGDACEARGKYAEAESLYRRALELREKGLGNEHADVVDSLNRLALLYLVQGKFAEAEPLYKRALAVAEKTGDVEPLTQACSLNGMAHLAYAQGKYVEAEPLLLRALRIREKITGAEHPDVAVCIHAQANLYRELERYDEAEPLYQRALHIREKAFGADHPAVAETLNSLARLHAVQERYSAAERLSQRALAICEKAVGPEHPQVAECLHQLAPIYYFQGMIAEAQKAVQRALTIREKALGAEHPAVGVSLDVLASLLLDQEKYTEAQPLVERSLAMQEKVPGIGHPGLAPSLNNLGILYETQGKHAAAELLFQRALSLLEGSWGKEHSSLIPVLLNYASLLRKTDRPEKAKDLEARARAIRAKHFKEEPQDSFRKRFLTQLAGGNFLRQRITTEVFPNNGLPGQVHSTSTMTVLPSC